MITIEAGEPRDVASIMPVMHDAFDSAFGEAWSAAQCLSLLSLPSSNLYLARLRETVIGFAITRWVLDEEELLMIGVAKEKQRTGIGKFLLDHVMDQAKDAGRLVVFLEVRNGNAAEHFYKVQGFSETGRRKSYYKGADGLLFDAITMKRQINELY